MRCTNILHINVARLAKISVAMIIFTLFSGTINAQGSDPGLAALVVVYEDKAKKMYKAQEAVQLLEATNHIWLNSETSAIYDLQKEFNDYISAFRNVISYAAQVYGFYYEKVYWKECFF